MSETANIKGPFGSVFYGLEFVRTPGEHSCEKCISSPSCHAGIGCTEITGRGDGNHGHWIKSPPETPAQVCEWKYENGEHKTTCGNSYIWSYDGESVKNFKFCPYCGKTLKEVET